MCMKKCIARGCDQLAELHVNREAEAERTHHETGRMIWKNREYGFTMVHPIEGAENGYCFYHNNLVNREYYVKVKNTNSAFYTLKG